MRQIIISADDFGLTESVNAAVEHAARDGVLKSASLMVAAPAAADAVARAHAHPHLKVGLHLVLVEGKSLLPQVEIPDLVDAEGNFSNRQVALGFRYFFKRGIRVQLAKEIRAQYAAFAATGLALDHVNAHKHMHMHPTVGRLIIRIGREFGLRAIRIPREPGGGPLALWSALLKKQARRAGLVTNDYVAGLEQSGRMDETAFLSILQRLPRGITEIYFHPATHKDEAFQATMPGYDHAGEYAALLSREAERYIAAHGIISTTYSALAAAL